jgi:uncharacterized membrane protein YidH (DUF202 family)|tara:strand:- start:1006 stop:1317 length:312 start_codon:yes stop_codon:yes gene_type:complete
MNTTQLAYKRTNFANDRTFLASIRTNAIFAGLSALLVKNGFHLPALIILVLSILANIIIVKSYLKNKKNETYRDSSLIYSAILILVLVILFYVTIVDYRNLGK